jgi:hypothetical protein
MIAAMQIVRRRWPKAERGAVFARKRSTLPWVFSTDSPEPCVRTKLFDLASVSEGSLSNYEGHEFSVHAGMLTVNIVRVDRHHCGDSRSVEIARNTWIQIIHNFREVDQRGEWFFGEYRLNMGLFDPFSSSVFLAKEPHKVCELRKHINSRKPYAKSQKTTAQRRPSDS